MCRISLVVGFEQLPELIRRFMLHELMLMTVADDRGQKDGWGIGLGGIVLDKDGGSYQYADRGWVYLDLGNKAPLVGHVRQASSGTGSSTYHNAHPYELRWGTRSVVFCHNGFFPGALPKKTAYQPTDHYDTQKHDAQRHDAQKDNTVEDKSRKLPGPQTPETDSYYAALSLLTIAKDSNTLTREIIEEWVRLYPGAVYVCILSSDEDIYVIRGGPQRTFHLLYCQEGVIGCTNDHALQTIKDMLRALNYPQPTWKYIEVVSPYRVLKFDKQGKLNAWFDYTPPPMTIQLGLSLRQTPASQKATSEQGKTIPTDKTGVTVPVKANPTRPILLRQLELWTTLFTYYPDVRSSTIRAWCYIAGPANVQEQPDPAYLPDACITTLQAMVEYTKRAMQTTYGYVYLKALISLWNTTFTVREEHYLITYIASLPARERSKLLEQPVPFFANSLPTTEIELLQATNNAIDFFMHLRDTMYTYVVNQLSTSTSE